VRLRSHRAMTLVEVLAATVLLALVAGACASMLRGAAESMPPSAGPVGVDALSEFVQALLEPPAPSDRTEAFLHWMKSGADEYELAWPKPGWLSVHVRRLTSAPEADHAWLEFSCDDVRVWRWIHTDPPSEDPR
jgi:prepilin-type N-terminal cleavage/methylation domain-containing protein